VQSALISTPELARRLQVREARVREGIRSGRLSRCVSRAGGRLRFDPEIAVEEWTANRTRETVPVDIGLAAARKALLEEQRRGLARENARRAGELVELVRVEAAWTAHVVRVRTLLEGFASRLKQRCPHLEPAVLVEADRLMREALDELASGGTHGTQAIG
jgi:phage terminase Nu1 subunit (DNA packaging protein)